MRLLSTSTIGAALAAVTLEGPGMQTAAATTYTVDRTVGAGSVTGSIQTDGKLGVLASSNITGYNLQLIGAGASYNLTNLNSSVFVSGNDATAAAKDLLFNFSGVDQGYLLFQGSLGSGMHYYCDATASNFCFQGESVVPESFNSPSAQFNAPLSGNQIIGTAVPEFASWGSMLLGFGAVGMTMRARRKLARMSVNRK